LCERHRLAGDRGIGGEGRGRGADRQRGPGKRGD